MVTPPGAGGPGPPPVSSALPEPRAGVLPACAAGAHGLSPRPCSYGGIAPPTLRHLGVRGSHRWGRRRSALCSSPQAPSSRGMKAGAGEGACLPPWVLVGYPAQPDPASFILLSPCQLAEVSENSLGFQVTAPHGSLLPAAADQTVSLLGSAQAHKSSHLL